MSHLLTTYLAFHYLNGKAGEKIPESVKEWDFNPFSQFFQVTWPDNSPAWIIKQPFWPISNQHFDIANEGAVNLKIDSISAIAGYIPKFIDYDSLHRILITEYSEDYVSLSANTRRFAIDDLVANVAKMLGTMHFHITEVALAETKGPPWYHFKPSLLINNIAYFNPILQNVNHTFVRRNWLAALIVESPLNNVLFSLSQSWSSKAIIHGDSHWANILVKEAEGKIGGLQLCDWEFAGWGDEDWDCACFFQGILDKYLCTRINHTKLIQAGELFFEIYQHTLQIFGVKHHPVNCFEDWFKKVLQLAAIGSLQKLLKLDDEHTNISNQIIDPNRARIEFLLKEVITNPNPIKSF